MENAAAMMLGFALAAVGMDTVTGQLRLTFGFSELMRGFDFLIAVIGLFGIGEILLSIGGRSEVLRQDCKLNPKVVFETWAELPEVLDDVATQLRDRLLDGNNSRRRNSGVVHELRRCQAHVARRRQIWHRSAGGRRGPRDRGPCSRHVRPLLPMLALGIPGSPTAAVLLGGLLIWGLQPGPLLFVEQKDFVWGLIASMYLGNIVGLVMVLTCVPMFAAILRIPFSIIAPVIIVICVIGAYTVHNAMLDIWLMLLFGVIGYVFKSWTIHLRRWYLHSFWATAQKTRSVSR